MRSLRWQGTKREAGAAIRRECALEDERGGSDVLDRRAGRIEDHDLFLRRPPGSFVREDLAKLGVNRPSFEYAGLQRMVQVSDRRALLERVHHERSPREQIGRELPFVLPVDPDTCYERTGRNVIRVQQVVA